MTLERERAQEVAKTATLLAVVNVIAAPFYYLSAKAGITASTLVNGIALSLMHEQGRKERVIANTVNNAASFFHNGKPIENGAKNITKGGAAFYDEIEEGLQTVADSYQSHSN